MSDKTDAWMPLWIGAYLADTQHLSRGEHGAYLLLLMAYWRNGGALPDDDKRLAAIAKASPKEWKELRLTMAEFFTVAEGSWTQKRVEVELSNSKDRKTKAVSKAQAAAGARWHQCKSNAPSNATSTPQAMPGQCPTPSPLPTPIPIKKTKNTATIVAAPVGVSESVWSDFCQHRKGKGAKLTQTAMDGIQAEARKAGWALEAALRECCARGWTGFKAEWVGQKSQSAQTAQPQSFAERDRIAGMQRWERQCNQKHPDLPDEFSAFRSTPDVIDITPSNVRISQ